MTTAATSISDETGAVSGARSSAVDLPALGGGPCRLCGRLLTDVFVDLGMSPPCESYVPADRLEAPEVFYPLRVWICAECLLVQLPAHLSAAEIFSDYAYFSS